MEEILGPATELDLGFVKLQIAYDFAAIIAFKKEMGLSLLGEEVWTRIEDDEELLSAFFWAGLLAYQPGTTLQQARHYMLPNNVGKALVVARAAWKGSQPEVEEDPKQESLTEPVATPQKKTFWTRIGQWLAMIFAWMNRPSVA